MPSAPRPSIDRRLPLAVALVASLAVVVATALASSGTVREAEAATTATVTFAPVADSYVQAASPTTNSGSDKTVRAEGSPVVRSYLRFVVAGLPSGATVSSARLRLYARSASSSGVSIHGGVIDTTWGEKTITYANAPTFSASPLAASGTLVSRKWIDVAVTGAVVGNGPTTLVLTTTDSSSVQFSSREEKSASRPQLVVNYTTEDPPPPSTDPILVGAGDIADLPAGRSGADESTALLLDGIVAANAGRVTVFLAGDNAYENGSASDYTNYYEPTWGRHKAITKPVPGNHEYQTASASGYYGYFGSAAGDPAKGYYAYDVGAWRIYSLNSNIAHTAGSTQEQWLRADLAAHPSTACVAAVWHHPRYTSGSHSPTTSVSALWQALYDYNAEIVLVGHDHNYQRFAPQTANGARDDARGLRQFLVGTGGRALYSFTSNAPNTEVKNSTTFGVLKLTLHAASYDFEFVPIVGQSFTDAGTGIACH